VNAAPRGAIALCLVLVVLSAGIGAEDLMERPPWAACSYCHGDEGRIDSAAVPALAGQSAGYLVKQLADFREGLRQSPDAQMRSATMLLDVEDDATVADYFAALAVSPPILPVDDGSMGARLYWQGNEKLNACIDCHASRRDQLQPGYPFLFGLNAGYLERQLRAFRSAQRANDVDGTMRRLAASLTDEQISAVTRYLAGGDPIPVADSR
jgi:cytochrome c553